MEACPHIVDLCTAAREHSMAPDLVVSFSSLRHTHSIAMVRFNTRRPRVLSI